MRGRLPPPPPAPPSGRVPAPPAPPVRRRSRSRGASSTQAPARIARPALSLVAIALQAATDWTARAPRQVNADDVGKLQFVDDACREQVVFEPAVDVSADVWAAVEWVNARPSDQINAERERLICDIEAEARALHVSGDVARWHVGADAGVRKVATGVNGPLMEALAARTVFQDAACIEFFRLGAPAVGLLPVSGSGVPVQRPDAQPVSTVLGGAAQANRALLASLKEDAHSATLLQQSFKDARMGRVTQPVTAVQADLSANVLSPRFGVVQTRSNGVIRVRAVDDLTRAKVNGCTSAGEKFRPESIDALYRVARAVAQGTRERIMFYKADIDSAFRRLPAMPMHRRFLFFVFLAQGVAHVAGHLAMPFGAVASVHAWERVGALISHLVRRLLFIPMLRFVDDLFGAERAACAEHALECIVRLVRCILGPSAIAADKVAAGMPLVVLGLQVRADHGGFSCTPSPDKVKKWRGRIGDALSSGVLRPGDAAKLAGALMWACSGMFHRIGRALIRPLFAHSKQCGVVVPQQLRVALEWWAEVLALELCESRAWTPDRREAAQLFVDARSTPPRVAAVLFLDGRSSYSDWAPPVCVLRHFKQRGDAQIMSLELLAIAFGLSTFSDALEGRRVRLWSDNVGAEAATRKGASKEWDYSCLINSLWLQAAQLRVSLRVDRVPSKLNVSDLPSREQYWLLREIGASFVQPRLSEAFWKPDAWASLSAARAPLRRA